MAYSARNFEHRGMNSCETHYDLATVLLSIGKTMRAIRKERGLSQEELAHLASIDRSHLGRIERGERNLSIRNVLRIAAALGCRPSELLHRAGV